MMRRGVLPAACLVMLWCSACSHLAAPDAVGEYMDDTTGTTVRHLSEPAVFFRESPMLAVHARDYVSLAPLRISQAGQAEFLLWVWQWSTIDRGNGATQPAGLLLLLDGEPMELQTSRPRTLGRWPYAAPVNGGRMGLYTLTPSQLDKLARAREIVVVTGAGTAGDTYHRWRDPQPPLQVFARDLIGRSPYSLARVHD